MLAPNVSAGPRRVCGLLFLGALVGSAFPSFAQPVGALAGSVSNAATGVLLGGAVVSISSLKPLPDRALKIQFPISYQ